MPGQPPAGRASRPDKNAAATSKMARWRASLADPPGPPGTGLRAYLTRALLPHALRSELERSLPFDERRHAAHPHRINRGCCVNVSGGGVELFHVHGPAGPAVAEVTE